MMLPVWKLEADWAHGNMVFKAPSICNNPSCLWITNFSTSFLIIAFSDFELHTVRKFLWSLLLSSLSQPCLSVTFMHVAADLCATSFNGAHCDCNCFILQGVRKVTVSLLKLLCLFGNVRDPANLAEYGHEAQVLVLTVDGKTLACCVHPLSF